MGRTAIVAAQSLALSLALAAGCNETRPYPDLPEKNLHVRTVTNGGRVALEVHSLDDRCTATYEGFVALDRPLVEVGLPSDRPSLLVFEFRGPGALSSDVPIKKEVQLLPRAGNRYEVRVAYKDSIYDMQLREMDPRTGTDRELDASRRC